jgi:hypothetical protein
MSALWWKKQKRYWELSNSLSFVFPAIADEEEAEDLREEMSSALGVPMPTCDAGSFIIAETAPPVVRTHAMPHCGLCQSDDLLLIDQEAEFRCEKCGLIVETIYGCLQCTHVSCVDCAPKHLEQAAYGKSMNEIAASFECTRERIRQVQAQALRKLRHPVRMRYLAPFVSDSYFDPTSAPLPRPIVGDCETCGSGVPALCKCNLCGGQVCFSCQRGPHDIACLNKRLRQPDGQS